MAKDVCYVLSLDASSFSKVLDEDDRQTYLVQYTVQARYVSLISESDRCWIQGR